jgi:NAD(P)H-hydrate repair Nnr-like enzyme with NAD(P)H-hydrate epimerase domain
LTHGASRAALLVLPALALSATASACGTDKVDKKDLETKIAEYVKRQTDVTVDVDCPSGASPKQGSKFHCTTVLSGAVTDLYVTFTHDRRFALQVRPRVS